jgi:cysteine desulfurase / selenocysteine lyase
MSINTTSTSDRLRIDPRTSSPTQEEGGPKYKEASAVMAAFPDPEVIAKLANEFFAALPASPDAGVSLPSPKGVDLRGIPSVAPQVAVPDYPREMFSFPAAPNTGPISGLPQSPLSPPTSAMNESDFRAIAASLVDAMSLVPQSSRAAPAPAFLDKEKAGPLTANPQFPSTDGMFSFPSVVAIPSSPPTAPSALNLAAVPVSPEVVFPVVPGGTTPPAGNAPGNFGHADRSDPWASAPDFAGVGDVFSFPRVPGASVPGVPEPRRPQPSTPASQPVPGSIPAAPLTSTPKSISGVPNSAPSFAILESGIEPSEAEEAVYPGVATKFPAISEMFSFPGVPGVQSLPGVSVVPASMPAKPATESDFRTLPTSVAGASDKVSDSKQPAPGTTTVPPGVESVELRPDVVPQTGVSKRPLDPRLIRQDFPILQERVNGRPLIWLDNAATTQKPNAVIDRLSYFYRHENSNIHRAAHTLAARATDAYESAREKTRRFLNASSTKEIIFVRGTTEGINLVAQAWGRRNVHKDDEIVITWLEHHANIVPWQMLCSETGARLRVAPVNDRGEIILEEYEKLLGPRTRIVSFSQVSNALGTITPAREMVEMAHRHGARVLVDGAQAVSHMRADVQALDCDFYVFSGHKVFGPTGIGAVYGKLDVLETMPPWQRGGNMIVDVTFEKTTYQVAPGRFEAGTGNIADAVGLGAALDYVEQIGMESIAAYEHDLLIYATAGLLTVPGLKLIGTAREKAGVLSFVLDDVRTEDVGAALSQEGIAVRAGHHCAQPILRRMGVEATVRPSLAFYNTCEDVDALVSALLRLQAGSEHRKPY